MSEHTLHFDNAREIQDVTGKRQEYLPRMEQALETRLTSRDTWLKIEGEEAAVHRAIRFFECLREARNDGALLQEHSVFFALRAFRENREEELRRLFHRRIEVGAAKNPVYPRTFGQQRYVEAITSKDLVLGIGPAGTGKTYLAMAMAVSALLKNEVSRIILTRPAVEAGEALGFLPGDLHQKVLPYLRPLYDALYDMMDAEDVEARTARGIIEVAPLAYMRGRTLNRAFVILDEAQNTTPEQMLMFLTRLGFDSKCVVTGDITQVDLPTHKTSGLLEARYYLKNIEDIAIVELGDEDVVRHALVRRIIQAYRQGRENGLPGEGV